MSAEQNVRAVYVLSAIAEAEKIECGDGDYSKVVDFIVDNAKRS